MDIEILSDRGKVTNWPLSVVVENELPITAAPQQSEVRPEPVYKFH